MHVQSFNQALACSKVSWVSGPEFVSVCVFGTYSVAHPEKRRVSALLCGH